MMLMGERKREAEKRRKCVNGRETGKGGQKRRGIYLKDGLTEEWKGK